MAQLPPAGPPPAGQPVTTQAPATGWEAPYDANLGPAPGVRFASPGARLGGYIVDVVILFVVMVIVFAIAGVVGVGAAATDSGLLRGTAIIVGVLALLVYILWTLLYFPYFWSRGGQTPGMRMAHVKVVRDVDGGPITMGPAFLRLIGYWVNGLTFYIGFIWILVDKRRRGWHDLIAGTCVIEA